MMNQLTVTPSTLATINTQFIRQQIQNFIVNFSEVLSSVSVLASKKDGRHALSLNEADRKLKQALMDIIVNEEKYIVDSILAPIVKLAKRGENVPASTFFETRYGFTEQELLAAEFSEAKPKGGLLFGKGGLFNTNRRMSVQYVSTRGFKTKRQIKDAKEGVDKELTVFQRLVANNDALNPFQKPKFAEMFEKKIEKSGAADFTKAKTIDELDKVKLAFAEGYIAHQALNDKAAKAKTNFVKLLSRAVLLTILFYIVFSPYISIKANEPTQPGGSGIKFRVSLPGTGVSEVRAEDVSIRFADVRGVHEAKEELSDIVDYLRDPVKFTRLGAHLPRGVLLVGPPGVGKTLLAKAVAGEAGVAFFHASGSEFDEMFVGTGARKMRQLFQSARARAPCVIFIDEIDSVGAKRTSSPMHPYANQTINQMLAEMDGFEKNEGIIVLAATNRPDHLDKALTRPGRFDVEVAVDPPDFKGRLDILELYLNKIVQGSDIDITKIARKTVGFTGAELENLVNQAALKAALEGENEVNMSHVEWGYEKVTMGPAKLSKIPDEETNRVTAYHEAGHTLIAYFTKDAMPLSKVTIIPRGRALGYTSMMPTEKDQYGKSKSQLLASIDVSLGGRIAEEITFGQENVTTGASSDFQSATNIAENMVKLYGMSEKVGIRVVEPHFNKFSQEVENTNLSQQTQELVDQEIRRILQESYDRAKNLLKTHSHELKLLAEALLVHETLEVEDIKTIIEGNKLPAKLKKDSKDTRKPVTNSQKNVI